MFTLLNCYTKLFIYHFCAHVLFLKFNLLQTYLVICQIYVFMRMMAFEVIFFNAICNFGDIDYERGVSSTIQ